MPSEIIEKKKYLLQKIESQGVDMDNLKTLILLGSHLWGYAGEDSDIDLLAIYKSKPTKLIEPFDNVTIEIQVDLERLKSKMQRSNWDNYSTIKYCSYPLFGALPLLNFSRANIVGWLKEKYDFHISTIAELKTKQGFLTVMSRVFYLNHFFSDVGSFKLHDFLFCKYLTSEDKNFLEMQLLNLFKRRDNSKEEKLRMIQIAEELQSKIIELENK